MLGVIRRSWIVVGLTVLACAAASDAHAKQADSLAGEWIGRLDVESQATFLRITVAAAGGKEWTASVVLQPIAAISPVNAEARRILESWRDASVAVNGASWSVAAGAASNVIRLEVSTVASPAEATVSFRNQTSQVALHRLAIVDRSVERQYAGVYVLPTGRRVYIWRPSSGGVAIGGIRQSDGFLTYLEEATGRSGSLYPVASDAFIAGPTSVLPDPVRVRAVFRDDATGTRRLVWQEIGGPEIVATRSTTFRREDIQLRGPAGVLGCDVLLPVRAGRHPAAVLVPGAGANDRHDQYLIAQALAEHGVAALVCDKRGTGTSDGDWRLTSFEQQATDVAAGIRFLQQRTEIDASRVGVLAFSQGAWVAPIAVAGNPRVAFLILAAVPATSNRESLHIASAERLRREGASAAEITRNREFFERYQQAILNNEAAAIAQLWQQYAGASWLPANMPTAQTLNDWGWQRARMTWPYEPGPVLSRITCPVLAMWGAEDREFPPSIHGPRFEQSMRSARNADYTLRVVPGADHSFRLVAPSIVEQTGYAPEYLRTVLEWLTPRMKK